jgi:ATP-dependent RNA helicase DDX56/DBP9
MDRRDLTARARVSQVKEEAAAVAEHCGADLAVTALTGEGHAAARRAAVSAAGQLVVATPGRIAQVLAVAL